MAAPSVTNTFVNSTTASATEVNTNFTDLINGASDGTKDYTINALTCAATATFNGNVVLGNALSDDVTFTGSVESNVPCGTTATYNIGSSTIGFLALYLGANSQTVAIAGSASMSATWTFTLPITAGTDGYLMATNGSGTSSWQQRNDSSGLVNIGFTTAVAGSQLTVGLVSADGTAFSATNIGWVNFKHTTTTTGQKLIGKITAAPTNCVTIATSTLGFVSGLTHYVYVYLFYVDSTTFVIGLSQNGFLDNGALQSSTAFAASSNSNAIIYTPNGVAAVSSKPCRLLGRIKFSLTTAGTWDEVGDEVTVWPFPIIQPSCNYTTNATTAVVNNTVLPYEDRVHDTHGAYNTTTGVYTVPVSGIYQINASAGTSTVTPGTVTQYFGIGILYGAVEVYGNNDMACQTATARAFKSVVSSVLKLTAGDAIEIDFNENIPAVNLDNDANNNYLSICRIGD